MRILLVDDEPAVTEGLRHAFFQDEGVDILTADGGKAGLGLLSQYPVDVVVSDMRMPGMDGADFLKSVHELYPDCIRIIMSGYADDRDSMRVMLHAHQFVPKPSTPDELKTTINHVMEVRRLLLNPAVRKLTCSIDKLPQAPQTFLSLSMVLQDSEASLSDIADIISEDIGLCAKVLQLVNSAFFGFARPTTDVTEAVMRLGANIVRDLALSLGVFEQAQALCLPIDLDDLSNKSVRACALAQQLVSNRAERDTAGSAALLADIGILALCAFDRKRWLALSAANGDRWEMPPAAEMEAFGCTHAQVGAYLLALWGLPMPVVATVLAHHDAVPVPAASIDALSAVMASHWLAEGGAIPSSWAESPAFAPHLERISGFLRANVPHNPARISPAASRIR